ncbi:hypothetical protein RND81_09G125600 [Saponaria officinalis]|uniref:Uncharacterized protein n=1 Tax=Saponaria officinalis TaxID=3572 RepID=A0AAW1ILA8_SAPOF
MMAAKVVNLIGSESAATILLSNTRTSFCASKTTLTTSRRRKWSVSLVVQATFEPNSNKPDSSSPSTLQDDLKYLLKLGVGSVSGAALIKYGSAAVPDITRPDIYTALLMISTPPLIAVLLLARESRKN